MDSTRKISIREMKEMLVEAYNIDPRQNLGFRGTPGIGKTEGIYQAAEELGKVYPGFFSQVMILSQMESVDFRMPWVDNQNKYRFIPIETLRFDKDARGFLFLDEAANAAPDVMKAVQQMLSDRKLGDIIIPAGVMIVLASNNKSDRAGANSIPTAFANRIEWHQVGPDYEHWLEDYAEPASLDISLRTFIKKFPDTLNQFKADHDVNATPRSWAKTHKVLGTKFEYDRVAGLVGEELATQFCAWRRMWDQFPDKEDIEVSPEKAKLPSKADAQFALTCAMATWVEKKNWSKFFVYLKRLNLEYQMLYMKEATRLHPKEGFKDTKEYSDWIVEHQGKLI